MMYDALIIGGGPGGSTAATYLARAGKRVLVLEKEHFPRFHIGESLLPYNRRIFEEMGVLEKLEAAGAMKKFGAQFHLGDGSKSLPLVFRQGRFTREPQAFQVERATFDDLLLRHAQACGAEVREGWTVGKFTNEGDSVAIQARDEHGNTETFRGAFLIDASGRGNLTGNQEKMRIVHPDLKKFAVFGHFEGVVLDEGEKAGDTVIVRLEDKWFWIIPLSKEKVSVGCVMDQAEFARCKESPAAIFARIWQASPPLRLRMENARLIGQMHTTGDFSYRNRCFTGPRLLRVGDAAGFMDPIFSAGVFLACYSGKLAGELVIASRNAGDDGARRMKRYEKQVYKAMAFYWELVEGFYTSHFMDLFMSPRDKFSIPSAITAVLAGELEGGWAMRWRMRVFFWLVRIQGVFPLAPRLTYKDPPRDGRPAETTEQSMAEKR